MATSAPWYLIAATSLPYLIVTPLKQPSQPIVLSLGYFCALRDNKMYNRRMKSYLVGSGIIVIRRRCAVSAILAPCHDLHYLLKLNVAATHGEYMCGLCHSRSLLG